MVLNHLLFGVAYKHFHRASRFRASAVKYPVSSDGDSTRQQSVDATKMIDYHLEENAIIHRLLIRCVFESPRRRPAPALLFFVKLGLGFINLVPRNGHSQ